MISSIDVKIWQGVDFSVFARNENALQKMAERGSKCQFRHNQLTIPRFEQFLTPTGFS